MRIYIIGNGGITLCREPPSTLDEGEKEQGPSRYWLRRSQ
jgi:hypothetical protein